MDTILSKIGENLQKARKATGLTQSQVESILGINKTQLSYYETGKREVSISILEKLAILYGYSLQFFIDNKTEHVQEFEIAFRAEELSDTDMELVNWSKNFLKNLCEMKSLER